MKASLQEHFLFASFSSILLIIMSFYLINLSILLFLWFSPFPHQVKANFTSISISEDPFSQLLQSHQCPQIPLACNNPETIEEHRLLTRQLFHRLNLWKIGAAPPPLLSEHSPNVSFALLQMGKEIAKAGCPSHFISSSTLDMALYLFMLLHGMNKERYAESIGTQMFNRMAPILAACENSFRTRQQANVYFEIDAEDEDAMKCFEAGFPTPVHQTCRSISPDLSSCSPLTPRGDRFCPENNLILEIVWNIVDFVSAACLPFFRDAGATSAFHLWEQTQERLFTRKIKKYWYESRITPHEYQTMLGENVLVEAYNLEMCVEGMYSTRSNFAYRLNRPSYPFRIYRRRRRSVNGGLVYCP